MPAKKATKKAKDSHSLGNGKRMPLDEIKKVEKEKKEKEKDK